MAEIFRMINKGWNLMNDGGQYMGVFLAAILFCFVAENRKNKMLFLYCLLAMLLLWNPLTGGLLIKFFDFQKKYQYAFYLLPVLPLCAYCGTEVVQMQESRKNKIFLFCALFIICALAGRVMNTEMKLDERENRACIKEEYRLVFDKMLEEGNSPVLLANMDIMESARAYSNEVNLPYEAAWISQDESVWQQYYEPDLRALYENMQKPLNRLGGITQTARKYRCNYLILPIEADDRAAMENGGYRVVSETEEHVLYYDMTLE